MALKSDKLKGMRTLQKAFNDKAFEGTNALVLKR